ncbi:MAG: hypothetical protein CR989_00375 [Flavobacteriales bacterium]|nr:MAG: hypothetical protein CR989_00375 [Flavobacteriales bacterium]
MKKRNIILLLILLILLSFSVMKYSVYINKKKIYNEDFWIDFAINHKNYNLHLKEKDFNLKDFKDYINLNNPKFEIDFSKKDNFKKLNFNIKRIKDSIYIYDYGFDNLDKVYVVKNISFLNSLFVKGDLVLYKNIIYPFGNKITYDSIPLPPPAIPDNILDSIKELDSLDRMKFLDNYKDLGSGKLN